MWILNDTDAVYPEHTEYFYIEDYSHVLREETEQFILDQALALYEATKAQVVTVTVPDTRGDELETFSYTLANNWEIGDAELDNGVLILFTTDEPRVRMEVGLGLEGCIPDGKAGRILDEWAVDAKDNGRWNEAARNTFCETALLIYEEYGLEPPEDLVIEQSYNEELEEDTFADDILPEAEPFMGSDPLSMKILVAFFIFWAIALLPYLYLCGQIFGGGGISGIFSDDDSSGGFSGGSSGGGGSFGGGGASR